MQVSKIENQPNFKANFSNDAVTQQILRKVRRSAEKTDFTQMTDSSFSILGLIRKDQTLMLKISEDGDKLVAKTKNFWKNLFGKNEHFEQEIINDNISDAFVRLTSKISRLW